MPGTPSRPVRGRDRVAERFLWFVRTFGVTLQPMPVNGEPGVIARRDGRLFAVLAFETHDGRISQIHGIADPMKLGYAASVLGERAGR